MSTDINYKNFFQENGEESSNEYWGKKAAGVIIVAKDTGRILLLQRSIECNEEGTWGIPGGKIDGGESKTIAVKRETMEECGVELESISHLYTYTNGSFRYDTYLSIVPFEFIPKLNWESDGSKWVEYGDWPNPLHFGMEALIKHSGHVIKKVIDLLAKKRDNMFESMDMPPPAIVQKAEKPASTNVIDATSMTNSYIVVATLWGEARGEGENGMHAVMNVLMNRAKGDFSKVKDLCIKHKQFSMWNGVDDPSVSAIKLAKIQRDGKTSGMDGHMYKKAMELVDSAMKGQLPDITGGATFYFNPKKANPTWAKQMVKTKTIGNHDFYKPIPIVKKTQQVKEETTNFSMAKQGLVDDGIYGYELKSSTSTLKYGYEPSSRVFYLYNIATPSESDRNKGYAKALLEHFFQIIKKSNGALDVGPFTTSGTAYIKHVVERLAGEYKVRLV
jgi:N-acetylmuramoyl-L-alanine amidase